DEDCTNMRVAGRRCDLALSLRGCAALARSRSGIEAAAPEQESSGGLEAHGGAEGKSRQNRQGVSRETCSGGPQTEWARPRTSARKTTGAETKGIARADAARVRHPAAAAAEATPPNPVANVRSCRLFRASGHCEVGPFRRAEIKDQVNP